MKTVALTNFELARILSGHPMTCSTLDGEEVQVRLFTVVTVDGGTVEYTVGAVHSHGRDVFARQDPNQMAGT